MDEIQNVVSKYDASYIRAGFSNPSGVRTFAATFYKDVAEIFDAITRVKNVDRNPTGFSLDDAPILGLLVRMWKLMKEITRYYEADNAEMIGLLDRAFLEAAVTAQYLMRGDLSVIRDYRNCSYRHHLHLLEEHRTGSPFFETKAGRRLLSSIHAKLEFEGLTDADFEPQRRNRWRVGGKSFYDIFDEVHDRDLYPMSYGIMSESIHGSWNDSMDFCLTKNPDGTFSAFPFFQPADPRFVSPLLRFGVPVYRLWLARIECQEESFDQLLAWVERMNSALLDKFDELFDGP